MTLRTCVHPDGLFRYGIHKPAYSVHNLRADKEIKHLGLLADACALDNQGNFPEGDLRVEGADWIFEIPNPLAFRGTTFIDKEWADASVADPRRIGLPPREEVSLATALTQAGVDPSLFAALPSPLLLALATCSTDPEDLIRLAEHACQLETDGEGRPIGLHYYQDGRGRIRARIHDHALFEAVANNPALPDPYKRVMVIRPGAQGGSEIVGDAGPAQGIGSHVFEYLRRNSYIAGGHYAANMADDAIRYATLALSQEDMHGLRHLYYQRTFLRLAHELGLPLPAPPLRATDLEGLRLAIVAALAGREPTLSATLWGWNYGFDYAPSGYRLHASHQQIHQQYALLPQEVAAHSGDPEQATGRLPAFGCGDMVAEMVRDYRDAWGREFFDDYLTCIRNNQRMDGQKELERSLVVWEDEQALLFVPKAQTSQWELQLMTLGHEGQAAPGNIIEADARTRASLDQGILKAQQALAGLGARMVTSIEYPKRIGATGEPGQRLLYAFLPRLPESPGAFSEAQLRFINGHYPEDFAAACRRQLAG